MELYTGNGEKIAIDNPTFSSAIRQPWENVFHRGWHEGVPGNTIPAFHLIKVNGYEWGECDVRMTSDLVPVVCHDNTATGMVDGVSTTLTISDSTAEQVTALVLASHETYGDIHIPTLAELLDFARCYGIGLVLDFKSVSVDNSKIIAQIVLASGWSEHCIYMPNGTSAAAAIQTIDKNASFDFVGGVTTADDLPDLTPYQALLTGANTVGFDLNSSATDANGGLPEEVFAKLREAGLSVSFWNIRATAYSTYFDKGPLRVTYQGFGDVRFAKTYLDRKKFW